MKVQRVRYLTFALKYQPHFDIQKLLRGEFSLTKGQTSLVVFDELTGKDAVITQEQLGVLLQVPEGEWLALEELSLPEGIDAKPVVEFLLASGLIVEDPLSERLLLQDRIQDVGWPDDAVAFHLRVVRREAEIARSAPTIDYERKLSTAGDDARKFIAEHGPAPSRVFRVESEGDGEILLDSPRADDRFFEVLSARQTRRIFDASAPLMSQEILSTVLRYSFGTLGFYTVADELILQHKASPSGGGLHPIEAFPLILGVEGIAPGLYHYDSERHSLSRQRDLERSSAIALLSDFAQGQRYVGDAQLVVLLVARWERNFWKYRNRSNTYNVVMMDAGHLSQTFYLTSTALGLGAFYTAALDREAIASFMELDGQAFSAIGICGCGPVTAGSELEFSPNDLER